MEWPATIATALGPLMAGGGGRLLIGYYLRRRDTLDREKAQRQADLLTREEALAARWERMQTGFLDALAAERLSHQEEVSTAEGAREKSRTEHLSDLRMATEKLALANEILSKHSTMTG